MLSLQSFLLSAPLHSPVQWMGEKNPHPVTGRPACQRVVFLSGRGLSTSLASLSRSRCADEKGRCPDRSGWRTTGAAPRSGAPLQKRGGAQGLCHGSGRCCQKSPDFDGRRGAFLRHHHGIKSRFDLYECCVAQATVGSRRCAHRSDHHVAFSYAPSLGNFPQDTAGNHVWCHRGIHRMVEDEGGEGGYQPFCHGRISQDHRILAAVWNLSLL